jgi:hypothetical protein
MVVGKGEPCGGPLSMRADLGSVDPAQFGRKTVEPNRYACTKDWFCPII